MEPVDSFAAFTDDPRSPFYCSVGLSPTETWDRSVAEMARVLLELPSIVASPDFSFSPALLCSWHKRIFGDLFPEDAGRPRWRHEGKREHVFFGGNVGTRKSRRSKGYRGAHPKRLPKHMQDICNQLNAERPILVQPPESPDLIGRRVYAAARLYVKLLRAHPWVDGNLRISFIALQAALIFLGLPTVEFADLEQHDDLIGWAFRGRNEPYRPLAEHIAGHIGAKMESSDD